MVKVEEAKPFIPVSLWDHMNPFLFSFHSQVVLQTAHHISIDPESSGSSGSVRPVSPRPSVTAWLALGLLISFSCPPLTCFFFCSFSFSTSRPPFQPHILFFWVADFLVPGFSIFSVSRCMFHFGLNLIAQIFSLSAHSLFMMYWFWVSVWRTFVALICIHTALLLQNRAFLLV